MNDGEVFSSHKEFHEELIRPRTMTRHNDWFSADKEKRATRVRGLPLAHILREVLANALDAEAKVIEINFSAMAGTRADRNGCKAFFLSCTDDGCGCAEPEILRRVGSSTSDLHPEKRGRFGQGLIDVLSVCDEAEILTLEHRLRFNGEGCQVSTVRTKTQGMRLSCKLRHPGEDFDELPDYFGSVILDDGISLTFNGKKVLVRKAIRTIKDVKVKTVAYDSKKEKVVRPSRETIVRLYDQHGDQPRIYELGIAVDCAPWALRYDIDVRQKTPLDAARDMLPADYKDSLIRQLIGPMSEEYIAYMRTSKQAPCEIKDNCENSVELSERAQDELIRIQTGHERDEIALENPLDQNNDSETHEVEARLGKKGVNRRYLPDGVKILLEGHQTVKELHDSQIKVAVRDRLDFPSETPRQRTCLNAFTEIASAIVGYSILVDRFCGPVRGPCGLHEDGRILLNIRQKHLWENPLGAESLAVLLHECAHERMSGHSIEFQIELERLAGRLAVWVGNNGGRWSDLTLQVS